MSRFLKTAIVLLAIAAMATPVMAEDMLSLGGQMRVRGWYIDDGGDQTTTFADQRLRIGGKLSVADGVSITFRFDATEGAWGDQAGYGGSRHVYDTDGTMQWDRAHIDLAFDAFSLRVGSQYVGFSQSGAFNAQDNGITVRTKGAVPVTAFFMVNDNNNGNVNRADGNVYGSPATNYTRDDYYFGANVGFGADAFKGNFFVAGDNGDNHEVYLIGADGTFNMDAFKLVAELNVFTGDASATADAYGTQLFLDASFAASEAMTVGGQLYYALGDTTDTQYVVLGNDFGGWDPLFAHGTGLDNEKIGIGRPFAAFGNGAGVIAGRLYADAKVSDALKVGGSFSYLEPEEDTMTSADSAYAVAIGMKYAVMAHTSLGALVEYVDVDEAGVDSAVAAGVGLFVNF